MHVVKPQGYLRLHYSSTRNQAFSGKWETRTRPNTLPPNHEVVETAPDLSFGWRGALPILARTACLLRLLFSRRELTNTRFALHREQRFPANTSTFTFNLLCEVDYRPRLLGASPVRVEVNAIRPRHDALSLTRLVQRTGCGCISHAGAGGRAPDLTDSYSTPAQRYALRVMSRAIGSASRGSVFRVPAPMCSDDHGAALVRAAVITERSAFLAAG